jgi:hypothetical protein
MGWMEEVHTLNSTRGSANVLAVYTTRNDFCRMFQEDMRGLYALSLLLTADSELAERCIVAGLDDCIKGNPVFKDWAQAWSRRTVITNAIRAVFSPGGVNLRTSASLTTSEWNLFSEGWFATAIQLDSLERFVFVMSFLEGYSDHECAVLLNKSRAEIVAARTRALQHLAEHDFFVEANKRKGPVRAISVAHL